MISTFWLAAIVAGIVVLIALVVVLLSRLRALGSASSDMADVRQRIEALGAHSERLERELREALSQARLEAAQHATSGRTESTGTLTQFAQTLQAQLGQMAALQNERLAHLTASNERSLEAVRATVEQRLDAVRSDNAKSLEQMRSTVDEKLHATLEQRLGQSFKIVSDRLELVHRGLGEMKSLAAGVGDLKKVLTNVKSRGGWGEVQLGTLLAEMLVPSQYAQNVATRPGSKERVEYAVKLPGRGENGEPCWLPIDCKFPLENFQRLQEAIEHADIVAVEASRKGLEDFFKAEARKIREKYVAPPHTTDFAILFVPTEGLYAEAVSRPGLADSLQRDQRVMLAGPMNLAAMLNSLQLGFRTLAIEQRSTEVWRTLSAVKTEFGKFGTILAKSKEKLDQVGRTLEEASRKSTTIARKLRSVEEMPESEAEQLLTDDPDSPLDLDDEIETLPLPLSNPVRETH